ncbi:MAG: MFS transporter, partial [Planctomycetaceae bacterium]|nr:MFS transporter [Planctomycetaceae bacterium]
MTTLNEGTAEKTTFAVLIALSCFHLFNDSVQSLIQSVYLMIRESLSLDLAHIGLITLTYQLASSMFQPVVGLYTDRHPQPYALPLGMGLSMAGLYYYAVAGSLSAVLLSVVLVGAGSAIFHPEASRLAHLASGGRSGLAQSLFQVGGNFGSALGPLAVARWVTPYGLENLRWFTIVPFFAMFAMFPVTRWYKSKLHLIQERRKTAPKAVSLSPYPTRTVVLSLGVLLILVFSKYVYWASLGTYYMFYLEEKFAISAQSAQYCLFLFSFSVAAGTVIGGPVGDRYGRKYVIWVSILGVAPFTLIMPYVQTLWATCVLSVLIGLILSSAFSAILIFAQELLPGKVGMIAGFFFGFAFGIAGISSAVLGSVADKYGIDFVYHLCSYLPLLGIFTYFLPNLHKKG